MGLRVVRLKSGDPGIFGRLEEEITVLREADIPFEIIPGVTSAAAAAASAMIPLTRRLSARRLQFITGHDISGGLPDDLNLSALADAKATTAVFMPKRTFPALAKLLMDEGLPGSTPAILAENVSLADEEVWRGTVESLAARLADDPGSAPAIIIYGTLAD